VSSWDGPAPGAGDYVVRHGWRGFLGSVLGLLAWTAIGVLGWKAHLAHLGTRALLVAVAVEWTDSTEVIAPDGAVVTASNTDPRLVGGQIVEVVGKFSSPDWEREVLCPSRLRFIEAEALDALLSRAGLTVAERYGRWDRSPFTRPMPEIITIATGG
jgi:hypothetical protein